MFTSVYELMKMYLQDRICNSDFPMRNSVKSYYKVSFTMSNHKKTHRVEYRSKVELLALIIHLIYVGLNSQRKVKKTHSRICIALDFLCNSFYVQFEFRKLLC